MSSYQPQPDFSTNRSAPTGLGQPLHLPNMTDRVAVPSHFPPMPSSMPSLPHLPLAPAPAQAPVPAPARASALTAERSDIPWFTAGEIANIKPKKPSASSGQTHGNQLPTMPDRYSVEMLMYEHIESLTPKKREKILFSRAMYDTILDVVRNHRYTTTRTSTFRQWARKFFTIHAAGGEMLLMSEGKPVAKREEIYDALCHCHELAKHGGRDKTCAQVRNYYSWIPKEIIAKFVAICPSCSGKKTASTADIVITSSQRNILSLQGTKAKLAAGCSVPLREIKAFADAEVERKRRERENAVSASAASSSGAAPPSQQLRPKKSSRDHCVSDSDRPPLDAVHYPPHSGQLAAAPVLQQTINAPLVPQQPQIPMPLGPDPLHPGYIQNQQQVELPLAAQESMSAAASVSQSHILAQPSATSGQAAAFPDFQSGFIDSVRAGPETMTSRFANEIGFKQQHQHATFMEDEGRRIIERRLYIEQVHQHVQAQTLQSLPGTSAMVDGHMIPSLEQLEGSTALLHGSRYDQEVSPRSLVPNAMQQQQQQQAMPFIPSPVGSISNAQHHPYGLPQANAPSYHDSLLCAPDPYQLEPPRRYSEPTSELYGNNPNHGFAHGAPTMPALMRTETMPARLPSRQALVDLGMEEFLTDEAKAVMSDDNYDSPGMPAGHMAQDENQGDFVATAEQRMGLAALNRLAGMSDLDEHDDLAINAQTGTGSLGRLPSEYDTMPGPLHVDYHDTMLSGRPSTLPSPFMKGSHSPHDGFASTSTSGADMGMGGHHDIAPLDLDQRLQAQQHDNGTATSSFKRYSPSSSFDSNEAIPDLSGASGACSQTPDPHHVGASAPPAFDDLMRTPERRRSLSQSGDGTDGQQQNQDDDEESDDGVRYDAPERVSPVSKDIWDRIESRRGMFPDDPLG